MILFSLKCSDGHEFEGWFRSGAAYEDQVAGGAVTCPVCASTQVAKAPMAPRIQRRTMADRPVRDDTPPAGATLPTVADPAPQGPPGPSTSVSDPAASTLPPQVELLHRLRQLRRMVEATAHHVGPAFAEEARRIHYGEAPARPIYGDATPDEAAALGDEGIQVARIPWVPTDDA